MVHTMDGPHWRPRSLHPAPMQNVDSCTGPMEKSMENEGVPSSVS